MERFRDLGAWVVAIMLAGAYLLTGGLKLVGSPDMVAAYGADQVHFMPVTPEEIRRVKALGPMPVVGDLKVDQDGRASWFSHKSEEVRPYYYRVYLSVPDVTAEIAPTDRAAHFRFTYPASDRSYLVVDGFEKGSHVQILPEERTILGYCRYNNGGVPDNFHNYFIAVFDHDFEETLTWKEGKLQEASRESEGKHVMAVVRFKTGRGEKVHVRVASSFISPEQARLNLTLE